MELKRNGSQPSMKGPSDNLTGDVHIDPLFQAPGAGEFGGASVTFEPGARLRVAHAPLRPDIDRHLRSWVDAVLGRTQSRNPPRGCHHVPAGKKHWHAASETTAMTHIAIQEALNGKNVE